MSVLMACLSLCSWCLVWCLDLVSATLVPHACSLVSYQRFYSFSLPKGHCSSLEKKKRAFNQAWCPWRAAGPGSPRRPRARKACELWRLALPGRALGDHLPSSGGLLGSHLEASWGKCPAEGRSICCLSGDARWWGFGWAPSRSVSLLTHSEAPKCKGKMIMVL